MTIKAGAVYNPDGEVESSAAVITDPKSDTPRSPDSLPLDIAENAKDAGCYTFVTEVWTVDEGHRELTDSIRKLADPRYVPLLCKRIYRTPADTEISRTYHCIGKYIQFPTDEDVKEQAIKLQSVPRGFPFPEDQIHCLRILWAPWNTKDEHGRPHHPVEYNNNTPPEEVEIGGWLLDQMLALKKFFDTGIDLDENGIPIGSQSDKLRSILEAETNADNKRMEAAREEARYRMRNNWPQMKRAMDEGRWSAPQPEKPLFLDLGKKTQ